MPGNKRDSVRTRVDCLREHLESARAGVGRDHSHGIDNCTPEQQRLRALIALSVFNTHETNGAHSPSHWGLSPLVAYTITVSPRYNRLVLICDAPDNVVSYLLPKRADNNCLPGLRLEDLRGFDTYITRHVPTGAELVVTGLRDGRWPRASNRRSSTEFQPLSQPLSAHERDRLNELPKISHAAERLMAGLFCRIAARYRHDWALGNWFYDPLNRPGSLTKQGDDSSKRRLWGAGNHWLLEWHRFPFEEDVAAALTGPPIGMAGASQVRTATGTVVQLNGAQLTLRGLRL